jgi:hypothetical protein
MKGGLIMKHRLRLNLAKILSILFLCAMALPASAVECLSPSYSVQMGREPMSDIEARDLRGSEYQDLQELFQGLSGAWAGTGQLVSCMGPEDTILKETENFTIDSKATTYSDGRFALESTYYATGKRASQAETLYLFLSKERLTTRPNIPVADIELISVSRGELTFIRKNRTRTDGGAIVSREALVSIRKPTAASFVVENFLYFYGRLTSFSTMQLERK